MFGCFAAGGPRYFTQCCTVGAIGIVLLGPLECGFGGFSSTSLIGSRRADSVNSMFGCFAAGGPRFFTQCCAVGAMGIVLRRALECGFGGFSSVRSCARRLYVDVRLCKG